MDMSSVARVDVERRSVIVYAAGRDEEETPMILVGLVDVVLTMSEREAEMLVEDLIVATERVRLRHYGDITVGP